MEILQKALSDLTRGEVGSLDAFFHTVEANVSVGGTSATCHFHCINLDGNGRPRVDALVLFLVTNILDYAIPRRRIREATEAQSRSGSSAPMAALLLEAMGLFTRLAKSGEGGELMLFLLAERFLQLPQLMCKMNLKTSTAMHYHGADGLHVGVDANKGRLCLYWGESKLHGDVTGAVYDCMKSIAPLLHGNAGLGSPEERDLQLLGQFLNVEDAALEAALKAYLDPTNPAFCQVEYRGLCLVGFDSDLYPSKPNLATVESVKVGMAKELKKWQASVKTRVAEEKIDSFSVHVFMLPFPSVEAFRASFRHALSPNYGTA